MIECLGKLADHIEAEPFPEPDGSLVGTYYEIELHRTKAALGSVPQRMFAHHGCDSAAARFGCGHVSAIGHVAATAALVRLQIITADDLALIFRDENLV